MKKWVLLCFVSLAVVPAWGEESDQPVVADDEAVLPDALTEAEKDAEIESLERALEEPDDVKEFIPSKPISADLPVSLPSDI